MERTFVIIKPNAMTSGLVGRIIARYESARLSIVATRLTQMTQADVERFYAEHIGKSFFDLLARFMTSGPSILLVLAGEGAIAKVRAINGATNPEEAVPGTIRYDWASYTAENVVHSSDSEASATREISIWFKPEEIFEYEIASQKAKRMLS